MKEIKIHLADPIEEEVRPITIEIKDAINLDEDLLRTVEDVYTADANNLASALVNSLPQGTLERLIIRLLKSRVSSYRGIMSS